MRHDKKAASDSQAVFGTQTIARASLILRMIARHGIDGARLTDLKRTSGLPHPTIRRMLKCMIDERLVIQNQTSKRYLLGPLNFELGLGTFRDTRRETAMRDIIQHLARKTGDTVYLMAQCGTELVCLDRAEGNFPIRVHLFNVGGRRPLGIGAAGQALLAHQDDSAVEAILARNDFEIDAHRRLTKEKIIEGIDRARARGFALSTDVYTMGIGSIGVAILEEDGPPVYAINISTVGPERFTPQRIEEIVKLAKSLIDGNLSCTESPVDRHWPSPPA